MEGQEGVVRGAGIGGDLIQTKARFDNDSQSFQDEVWPRRMKEAKKFAIFIQKQQSPVDDSNQ